MVFWAVEVKPGESLKVGLPKGSVLHLKQACLGETNEIAADGPVYIYRSFESTKHVLGQLIPGKIPLQHFDLSFDNDFELAHSWKYGSVFFAGNRVQEDTKELNFFDKLPREVTGHIFCRLPLKALVRCTAVQKSWNSMIKKPSFILNHLKHGVKMDKLFLLHLVKTRRFCRQIHLYGNPLLEFYYLHKDNSDFEEYCRLEFPTVAEERDVNSCFRVVGTCHGLVCLSDDISAQNLHCILSNPMIRKSLSLPESSIQLPEVSHMLNRKYRVCTGFGYDAATNDYKVARLFSLADQGTVFEVYSLARGSWRSLGSVEAPCQVVDCAPQALVNGRIHWPAHFADQYFILGFDLGSELIFKMEMPEIVLRDDGSELRLSVSRDGKSIALFRRFHSRVDISNSYVDVWEMREYGVHSSWSCLMRILASGDPVHHFLPKPLCFGENKLIAEQVDENSHTERLCAAHQLASIDLHSQEMKMLGQVDYTYFTVNGYEPSLVLLGIRASY